MSESNPSISEHGSEEDAAPSLVVIPFASRFLEPIVRESKTATVRIERYDVEAGDEVILANESTTVEWAIAEVAFTVTCAAHRAASVLERLNAEHSLTKTDRAVIDVLQPHYSTPVRRDDIVQIIIWNVQQAFAEAPALESEP